MTENLTVEERLKSYNQPTTSIRDSTISSQGVSLPPSSVPSVQEELVTMEEIRRKQDDEDEISGKLVFVKGDSDIRQIKGGTIEKLVERLTDGVTYGELAFFFFFLRTQRLIVLRLCCPLTDSQFQQAFLLTFRAFMKQETLLSLMIQRYDLSIEDPAHPGLSQPIRLRVCNTLKYWMDNFWFDFLDNQLIYDRAFEFVTTKVLKDSPKMSEQLSKLMDRKRRGSITVGIQRRDLQQKPISART